MRKALLGKAAAVLFIDNDDSFSYNIVDLLYRLQAGRIEVASASQFHDAASWRDYIFAQHFSHLIVGPGPGSPWDRPMLVELICRLEGLIPILGVCLGHQIIAAAYGSDVAPTGAPAHGVASRVAWSPTAALFQGMSNPCLAARYHSLAVKELQQPLIAVARTEVAAGNNGSEESVVMALQHCSAPTFGVQFHPESFLSDGGSALFVNFLNIFV